MCNPTHRVEPTAHDPTNALDETTIPVHNDTIYQQHQPIGDILLLPKPSNITRIMAQNPNGFNVGPAGNLPDLLLHVQEAEADITMLPEINCDITQGWILSQIHSACRQTFGTNQYRFEAAHSDIRYQTQYKPGGVMMMTVGNTTGRILSSGSDSLGRWVYTRFNGSAGRTITIIATYQVCKGNPRLAGDTTAIKQQYSMLERMRRQQPHRIRHHHTKDLCQFVQTCKDQGDLVCVGGDFNETLGENGGGLTRLCSDFGLVDAILQTNRSHQFQHTHHR